MTRRLFFALWPDEACRSRLQAAVAPLLAQARGRALDSTDWHVTLCFLGSVDVALLAALQGAAGQLRLPAFALPLEAVRYWRQARVIAAVGSVTPPQARQLAQALRSLSAALGLWPDDKPLRPHVTLMRSVSPARWREALPAQDGEGAAVGPAASTGTLQLPRDLTLRAEVFHLAESVPPSTGLSERASSRYVSLAHWALGR